MKTDIKEKNRKAQGTFRDKQRKKGFVPMTIWVPEDKKDQVKDFVKNI